jgi:cysteine desulfuration protein SufE
MAQAVPQEAAASGIKERMATIDEIRDNFELLDEWDDRYRYVIELGRTLTPLSEQDRTQDNKVQGCASQVWLSRSVQRNENGEPVLTFVGDSDAYIVRGLIAILLAIYSGQTAKTILDVDAIKMFDELGFREHLSPQRSNGLRSMVQRVRRDAEDARQGLLT